MRAKLAAGEGRIIMAGPGGELQGADGATRASEINKAGRSTAGVRSVVHLRPDRAWWAWMAQVLSCSPVLVLCC